MHKQMYHKTAIVEFIGKVASRTGTVEGKGTQKENCAFCADIKVINTKSAPVQYELGQIVHTHLTSYKSG